MYLEELIESDQLENDTFEAKAILNRDDVVGWLKTIAGFANASGGDFYIGVEDKTNKLIGFDRKSADNERNYFNNQVNEHLIPRPSMDISFLRYAVRRVGYQDPPITRQTRKWSPSFSQSVIKILDEVWKHIIPIETGRLDQKAKKCWIQHHQ